VNGEGGGRSWQIMMSCCKNSSGGVKEGHGSHIEDMHQEKPFSQKSTLLI